MHEYNELKQLLHLPENDDPVVAAKPEGIAHYDINVGFHGVFKNNI